MMETEEGNLNTIKTLFLSMGASESQAQVMASQLLKRAGQIAVERDVSTVEAVEILLKQVVEARQGS
jgi:hypothetical protein